jgi:hypothetical protein
MEHHPVGPWLSRRDMLLAHRWNGTNLAKEAFPLTINCEIEPSQSNKGLLRSRKSSLKNAPAYLNRPLTAGRVISRMYKMHIPSASD